MATEINNNAVPISHVGLGEGQQIIADSNSDATESSRKRNCNLYSCAGLFYPCKLDKLISIPIFEVSCLFQLHFRNSFKSSTVDPDRTTHSLTSHPGLHLLQWSILGMLGISRFMTNWDIHQIFAISLLLRWLRCCFAVILINDSFIISGKAWYVIDPSEVIYRSNLEYKAQIPKALDIKLNFYLSRDMTKQTKWLCVQRRLSSALAPTERTEKTLIRLGGCQGWSESSLGAHSFCWFCHVPAHLFRSQQTRSNWMPVTKMDNNEVRKSVMLVSIHMQFRVAIKSDRDKHIQPL